MRNEDMMKCFKERNDEASVLLNRLKDIVNEGLKLGVNLNPDIQKKLENVINIVGCGKKLKVALIGGFSEGKTSIAAAWIGRVDKSSMKISQQESSDEVVIYTVDDDIELIDTPGLFGLKEKYNDEIGYVEKYKDITKKYVSEAHLILYIMDSVNPIKESHKEDLLWLFGSLKLLPRTIFVLSRFDEIADMDDDGDYHENLRIKKGNVTNRLTDVLKLTNDEKADLQIVGVSANPFGMGTEYWLQNTEQFKKISRIDTLQVATIATMKNRGGYFNIIYEMQKSVIHDILEKQMGNIIEQCDKLDEVLAVYKDNCVSLGNNIRDVESRIVEAQSNLVKYLNRYFGDLISQARGCGMETAQRFIEVEVGKDCHVMYANIQIEFSRQTKLVNTLIEKTTLDFNADINQFDSTIMNIGKGGIRILKGSNLINSKNILAVRDGAVGLGKALGIDLAQYLKFKPWGAINFAKNISSAVGVIGLLLDAYDEIKRQEAETKFKNAVDEMVEGFENIRRGLLDMVQSEKFAEEFFPQYVSHKEAEKNETQKIKECKVEQAKVREWCAKVEQISRDCKKLV